MRKVFVGFNQNGYSNELAEKCSKKFAQSGLKFTSVINLDDGDQVAFKKAFEYLKNSYECIVMSAGFFASFNVKETVCDILGVTLVENETAKEGLQSKRDNKYYCDDLYLLPEDCTVIPNNGGVVQGYILECDVTLIVISDDVFEGLEMVDNYVLPYLQNKFGINRQEQYFRLFGVPTGMLDNAVENFNKKQYENFSLTIENDCMDTFIKLSYESDAPYNQVNDAVDTLTKTFNEYVYSATEYNLQETLVGLLKMKNRKLSVAESFTGGNVCGKIVSVSGASEVLKEGVVTYSEEAKVNRLGVSETTLIKHGAVSEDTAYEMAVGLLKNGADIALATTGLAGPNSDRSGKPVGLCFIAVGTIKGVYVYKYNFSGNREKIIKCGVNTALYKTIKLVKELPENN